MCIFIPMYPPAAGAPSRLAATPGVKEEIHAREGVFFSILFIPIIDFY